jgi:hypothetical protein
VLGTTLGVGYHVGCWVPRWVLGTTSTCAAAASHAGYCSACHVAENRPLLGAAPTLTSLPFASCLMKSRPLCHKNGMCAVSRRGTRWRYPAAAACDHFLAAGRNVLRRSRVHGSCTHIQQQALQALRPLLQRSVSCVQQQGPDCNARTMRNQEMLKGLLSHQSHTSCGARHTCGRGGVAPIHPGN